MKARRSRGKKSMAEPRQEAEQTAVNHSLERYLGNTIRELRQQHGDDRRGS